MEVLRSEKLEKVLDWVIKSSSESTLKAQLSRLKLLMKQLPLELSDFIIQIIIQVSRLCLLSLLVERFEEVSRYPNIIIPSIGPSLFTKDHPLTNKLEQLQKLTENSINKLDALFRDFSK